MSSKKVVNIVSFDIPIPANYGGVIDVFYKLKRLYENNVDVIFHAFHTNKRVDDELEKYCLKVYYYPRKRTLLTLFSKHPFIVKSRADNQLLNNLLLNKSPIIFEGLHTSYFIDNQKLKNRLRIVRAHNLEHEYYQGLARTTANIFMKCFFWLEAIKLKKFESKLNFSNLVWSISMKDDNYFRNRLTTNVEYLPVFHPYNCIQMVSGSGNYCLYHGNLSVPENEKIALFLIADVFLSLPHQLIISGKNPSRKLMEVINNTANVLLVANPTDSELKGLIQKANINILPAYQSVGIRLKLLAALYLGKHCLVNEAMLLGTNLSTTCHIAETKSEFQLKVKQLYSLAYTSKDEEERANVLFSYSTHQSVQKILEVL